MVATPKAVRVRTSDGWQDIALQGPQGVPGLTLAALISFGATFTGAETTGQATELADVGGIGAVSGTDYQITRGGTYIIIPSMESVNMNVNTTAQAILRRNPAGANEYLTQVQPSAALSSAGAGRSLAGIPIIKDLAAGDILRGRVSHSETGVSRSVSLYLTMFLIGSGLTAPQAFSDIYCQLVQGNRPQQSIPHNAWTLMQIPAVPQIVISRADGSSDDFTRNADGSITINKSGVYHMNASITADEPLSDGSNVSLVILKKAGATPTAIPGDILGGIFNVNSGGTTNQYPGGVIAADQYCVAGDRIAFYVYCFAGGAVARLFKLHSFGIHRTGVGPQGPPGPANAILESVTPPVSPNVGDLWLYHPVAGISWLFRYEPDQDATYPWQFVGGPPYYQDQGGPISNTAYSTWEHLNSLSWTPGRSGIYQFTIKSYTNQADNAWAGMHVGLGSAASMTGLYSKGLGHTAAGGGNSIFFNHQDVFTAGVLRRLWFHTSTTSGNGAITQVSYQWITLSITPVRVA